MTFLSLQQLNDFLNNYPHEDIADIGGWQEMTVDVLEFKPGKEPRRVKARLSQSIDRCICDLVYDVTKAKLPRQHQTIICMDTFEHLYDPVRAAENIVKSLKSGGYLFLTTVFMYKYHRFPVDTYRYTDDSLKWLFRGLEIDKVWFEEEITADDPTVMGEGVFNNQPAKIGREWRVSIIAHKKSKVNAKAYNKSKK